MLIAIDAVYPLDATTVAEQLAEPLLKELGLAHLHWDVHVPLPPKEFNPLPIPPALSAPAKLLYYAAHMRNAMDKVSPEQATGLHLGVNWHDTIMAFLGEYTVQSWHRILDYASVMPVKAGIQLLHQPAPTPQNVAFMEKFPQMDKLFRVRQQLPNHWPVLAVDKPVLDPQEEILPEFVTGVAQFLRQHFPKLQS